MNSEIISVGLYDILTLINYFISWIFQIGLLIIGYKVVNYFE